MARQQQGVYKYKLRLAYNGIKYQGFQVQRHLSFRDTVQGQIEHVWAQLFQEAEDVSAMQVAGRTDSGVHAQGQVFAIMTFIATALSCNHNVHNSIAHQSPGPHVSYVRARLTQGSLEKLITSLHTHARIYLNALLRPLCSLNSIKMWLAQ